MVLFLVLVILSLGLAFQYIEDGDFPRLKRYSFPIFSSLVLLILSTLTWQAVFFGNLNNWHWISIWYGLLALISCGALCVMGVAVCLGVIYFTKITADDSSTVGMIKSYLNALKDKVCPLVKTPYDE